MKLNYKSGFTIFEFLIAISIMALLVAIVFSGFTNLRIRKLSREYYEKLGVKLWHPKMERDMECISRLQKLLSLPVLCTIQATPITKILC